jgi:hypothetical protein
VISTWSQIRLFGHFPGPMRPIVVYKLEDGTYTESPDDPDLIAITYTGGTVYTVDQAEADALVAAGYGAFVDFSEGREPWKLDSTFVTLDSTEWDLSGEPIEP